MGFVGTLLIGHAPYVVGLHSQVRYLVLNGRMTLYSKMVRFNSSLTSLSPGLAASPF